MHKYLLALSAIVMCSSTGAPASQVSGAASVTCNGGAHEVRVAGSYYEPISGEYDHILLQRHSIGTCEPDEFLTDAVLPWAPVDEGGYASFSASITLTPPRTDQGLPLRAMAGAAGRKPDGDRGRPGAAQRHRPQ